MLIESLGESLCDWLGTRTLYHMRLKAVYISHGCNSVVGKKFVVAAGAASNEQRCSKIISNCWNND